MFASGMLDYKDLIFQDSTVRLVAVEPDEQNYVTYLGPRFVRAMERMEGIDSITAASCHPVSSLILITALALLSWFRLWSSDYNIPKSDFSVVLCDNPSPDKNG